MRNWKTSLCIAASIVAGIAVGHRVVGAAKQRRPHMVRTTGNWIAFPDVKDKARYVSPRAGHLLVKATASLPEAPQPFAHTLAWQLMIRNPATREVMQRITYDHQPFAWDGSHALSPTFQEDFEFPPGRYLVTVTVISSTPHETPSGVEPMRFGLDSFYETVR